jgi:hypothetical protein
MATALLSLAAAIVAAAYWWKASKMAIQNSNASISDVPELYIMNAQIAFNESSRLNSRAAIWTGAAAILSALSAVSGAF